MCPWAGYRQQTLLSPARIGTRTWTNQLKTNGRYCILRLNTFSLVDELHGQHRTSQNGMHVFAYVLGKHLWFFLKYETFWPNFSSTVTQGSCFRLVHCHRTFIGLASDCLSSIIHCLQHCICTGNKMTYLYFQVCQWGNQHQLQQQHYWNINNSLHPKIKPINFEQNSCRQARKVIYPGPGSSPQPPACKSGALPSELQFCRRFVTKIHSELTVLHGDAPLAFSFQ